MNTAQPITPEAILKDLLDLARRHLVTAEKAFLRGRKAEAEIHLHNFYAIAEAPRG